ncbi:hypothetical protein CEXT_494381 [Caerostris extrusa]|uniref:Uncharacterized protein n=1 Tax=Caerostris extrusa TaxID=172846 RepID=A0AAV4YGD5_CAEEX|nr:hypothetical protein CEXT_494381 [Caerostris extrusa]
MNDFEVERYQWNLKDTQLLTLEPQAQRSGEEGGVGCGNSEAQDLSTGLRRRPASMESSTCASETNPLGSSKLCTGKMT